MAVTRTTECGRITIADPVFLDAIKELTEEDDLAGRVWLSNKKGKTVTDTAGLSENDVAQILRTEQADDGSFTLTFCVTVRFGESIRLIARTLSDRLVRNIRRRGDRGPRKIIVQVTGIQSKTLTRRNMEIETVYENQ